MGELRLAHVCAHEYLLRRALDIETVHSVGHIIAAVEFGWACLAQGSTRFQPMVRRVRQ